MSVRAALPDLLAGLTAPREVATTVRGVAVGASPASTSHIDRWRSRVKRTKDLTRLRFDRQGVYLANNVHIPWSVPLARVSLLPVLPAVCAAGDIAEAVEVLATRDLWPWAVGDDASPRWWCERCQGEGAVMLPRIPRGADGVTPTRCPCARDSTREEWDRSMVEYVSDLRDPPSLAALVAVASLGVDTLRRAEGLALQLVGRAPRIVWRVMSREALREWSMLGAGRTAGEGPATIAQAEWLRAKWAGPSPWWLTEAPADVAAAWPAVRDLMALGVTPVALDGDRITLAVEAI